MPFKDKISNKKIHSFFFHTKRTHSLVPLYGMSLFTIGILNLTALFFFGIKESSYVLLISGACFWFGTNFVRSSFPKKTSNYYIKGRKKVLNSLGYCFGFVCLLVGILGCTYAWIKPKLWKIWFYWFFHLANFKMFAIKSLSFGIKIFGKDLDN